MKESRNVINDIGTQSKVKTSLHKKSEIPKYKPISKKMPRIYYTDTH